MIDDFCKKCQKNIEGEKNNDFYVTLYVQDVNDEENIMCLFAFKKDLDIDNKETEEFDKVLAELTGKTHIIEYNKPENDGKYKLVKIQKIE